jgi:hypothetical protein
LTGRKRRKKILFKDGLGHDEKTGRTEKEPRHSGSGE